MSSPLLNGMTVRRASGAFHTISPSGKRNTCKLLWWQNLQWTPGVIEIAVTIVRFYSTIYNSVPLTSSTLCLWCVTVWSTLQSSEHQNDQTQEQFLPSGNPSHGHLTLNVEHATLLYNYLFTTHTYFFISNLHISDLTHNCLYCVSAILYIAICILFFCCLSCPFTVILLNCGASVTITNSWYV